MSVARVSCPQSHYLTLRSARQPIDWPNAPVPAWVSQEAAGRVAVASLSKPLRVSSRSARACTNGAVVATDSASANADQDNGTVLHHATQLRGGQGLNPPVPSQ